MASQHQHDGERRPAQQKDVADQRDERITLPGFAKSALKSSVEQFSSMSQDPRQFIYEMVQNVDDTPHSGDATPLLTFALVSFDPTSGEQLAAPLLLILSRQDGFTFKDLKGICTISDGRNHAQVHGAASDGQGEQSTGEKGIGFKSVSSICAACPTVSLTPLRVRCFTHFGPTVYPVTRLVSPLSSLKSLIAVTPQ